MKFSIRRHASDSSKINRSQSTISLSPHLSIIKSYLGRSEGPPNQPKDPLLCLTLSTPSFLECTIVDVATTLPLYRIKTSGTTTTVFRRESPVPVVASSIKWPKIIPMKRAKARPELVLVLMKDGPWRGGDSLLKPSSRENSRKFRLPNHNHPMKWKLHGSLYWCTTPSILGAIATLDPRGSHSPKLTVYDDLHDRHEPHQPLYGGVPILLLDYLVVTALLLVTDLQEWALVPRPVYSKFPCSDQAEFASGVNPWKSNPMGCCHIETGSEYPSSTSRTGPNPSHPPAIQAVHSSRNSQWPDSFIDPDSDDELPPMPWRRSLSPVSEVFSPAVASESSYLLHRTSSVRGSTGQYRASSNSHNLRRSASESVRKPPQPNRGSASRSLHRPSLHDSVRADDVDIDLFPNVPQTVPLPEREPNPDDRIASQISVVIRTPRPLPLLPAAELRPPSLPSQHRPARILPVIPKTPCQPPVSPGLHATAVHPRSVDVPSSLPDSQSLRPLRPTDEVYRHRQPNITNTSRGFTQWINSLTRDPSVKEKCLRPSRFDAPPPAYNSLSCSLEQLGSQPVSSANKLPVELRSGWQR